VKVKIDRKKNKISHPEIYRTLRQDHQAAFIIVFDVDYKDHFEFLTRWFGDQTYLLRYKKYKIWQ